MSSIKDRVIDIIVEKLGVQKDQVQMNASFVEDLGADSLDNVELVLEFEEAFDIEIPEEQAEKIATVQQVVDFIEAHQKEKA